MELFDSAIFCVEAYCKERKEIILEGIDTYGEKKLSITLRIDDNREEERWMGIELLADGTCDLTIIGSKTHDKVLYFQLEDFSDLTNLKNGIKKFLDHVK
jgi:hypothetical protein